MGNRVKFERPKQQEIAPTPIKGLYINPAGEMFAVCEGCNSIMRFYKLQPVKVKVRYGRKWMDGIHIAKNGRIFTRPGYWMNFPVIEKQHRCLKCRQQPEVMK